MKVTSEKLENRQVQINIELDETQIESHKASSYKKLVGRYNVPGFRKGKAPRGILERFIGVETLIQEGLEELLDETTKDIVLDQELDAVAPPRISEIESLDPITFTAIVSLKPEVKLGDYESLRVVREAVSIEESQVDEVIENLRTQKTPWEPVERPVEIGDLCTLNIEGYAYSEGKLSDEPYMDEKSISYLASADSTYPVPGFVDQVVGSSIDEESEFDISVPDDFNVEELRGSDIRFKVVVQEVKEQAFPDIDDEWAKTMSLAEDESYESLADLKLKIRSDIEERSKQTADAEYEEKILDALGETAEIDYPPILLDSEIDHMIQDQDQQLRSMGISLEAYLSSSGQDPETIRDSLRPQAEKRIIQSLLVSELSEVAAVTPSEKEIEDEIQRFINEQPEGEAREQAESFFVNPDATETVKRRLTARKTVDMLTEIASTPEKIKKTSKKAKPKKKTTAKAKATNTKKKTTKKKE